MLYFGCLAKGCHKFVKLSLAGCILVCLFQTNSLGVEVIAAAGGVVDWAGGAAAGEIAAMSTSTKWVGWSSAVADGIYIDADTDNVFYLWGSAPFDEIVNVTALASSSNATATAVVDFLVPNKKWPPQPGRFLRYDVWAAAWPPDYHYAIAQYVLAFAGKAVWTDNQPAGTPPPGVSFLKAADFSDAGANITLPQIPLKVYQLEPSPPEVPMQAIIGPGLDIIQFTETLNTMRVNLGFCDNSDPLSPPPERQIETYWELPSGFSELYDFRIELVAPTVTVPLYDLYGEPYEEEEVFLAAANQLFTVKAGRDDAICEMNFNLVDHDDLNSAIVSLEGSFLSPFAHPEWPSGRTFYSPDWEYWQPLIDSGLATVDDAIAAVENFIDSEGGTVHYCDFSGIGGIGYADAYAIPEPYVTLSTLLFAIGCLAMLHRQK